MIRTTSFVHLRPDADPQCVDRLVESVRAAEREIDVLAVDAARTTPNSHRAGDVMLLGAFADADAAARTWAHPYVESVVRPLVEACAAHVETVRYPQGPATLRATGPHRRHPAHAVAPRGPGHRPRPGRTVRAATWPACPSTSTASGTRR